MRSVSFKEASIHMKSGQLAHRVTRSISWINGIDTKGFFERTPQFGKQPAPMTKGDLAAKWILLDENLEQIGETDIDPIVLPEKSFRTHKEADAWMLDDQIASFVPDGWDEMTLGQKFEAATALIAELEATDPETSDEATPAPETTTTAPETTTTAPDEATPAPETTTSDEVTGD